MNLSVLHIQNIDKQPISSLWAERRGCVCLYLLWPQPVPDILTPFYVAGGSYHLKVPVYSLCESSVVQNFSCSKSATAS